MVTFARDRSSVPVSVNVALLRTVKARPLVVFALDWRLGDNVIRVTPLTDYARKAWTQERLDEALRDLVGAEVPLNPSGRPVGLAHEVETRLQEADPGVTVRVVDEAPVTTCAQCRRFVESADWYALAWEGGSVLLHQACAREYFR